MIINTENTNTIIKGIKDFDLAQTLECGQCFRYYKQDEEDYVVVASGNLLHIIQRGSDLIFVDTDTITVKNIWIPYFDLERDYGEIKSFLLSKDKLLEPAIKEKHGVRILNQEFHEMLISFIISQNKQIPQIKTLVRRISEQYGTLLGKVNGKEYYSFPDAKTLGMISEEKYREMKTGFRAPYLFDASQRLATGAISAKNLQGKNEVDTRAELLKVKGVGDKVANCVMLFALGFRDAFPIDVWIKRIMETVYFDGKDVPKSEIQEFAKEKFGEYGGYAQQYLFCFGRDNKLGIN